MKKQDRRTWIVRITTDHSFSALTAGLSELGDVEHIQLKDGSVLPTSNTHVKGMPLSDGDGRRARRYTPEGLQQMQAHNRMKGERRHKHAVETLAGIIRTNAHAPLFTLVRLMNESTAKPSFKNTIVWTEAILAKYINEALEQVTAPNGPKVEG